MRSFSRNTAFDGLTRLPNQIIPRKNLAKLLFRLPVALALRWRLTSTTRVFVQPKRSPPDGAIAQMEHLNTALWSSILTVSRFGGGTMNSRLVIGLSCKKDRISGVRTSRWTGYQSDPNMPSLFVSQSG